MTGTLLLMGLLALLGQDAKEASTMPSEPEAIRVLAIQARQVDGAARYVAPSLEPVRDLLGKVPGNHFTEIGFHELEAHYGLEASADLGGGYTFSFRPSELTAHGEIVFECHIDLENGDQSVEALRVTGKATRGQGAMFRGLMLDEGEMMVIMSIAKEKEDPGKGGSGGSGQASSGAGGGAGEAGKAGGDGGDGQPEEEKEEKPTTVPELQSRKAMLDSEAPLSLDQDSVPVAVGDPSVAPDMATIEGILRALEEQDIAEQKSSRGRRFDVVIKGDWW